MVHETQAVAEAAEPRLIGQDEREPAGAGAAALVTAATEEVVTAARMTVTAFLVGDPQSPTDRNGIWNALGGLTTAVQVLEQAEAALAAS